MIHLTTTLKQFLLSIPRCHFQASRETWIVTAIEESQGLLALVDSTDKPQGVVAVADLLGLLGKSGSLLGANNLSNQPETNSNLVSPSLARSIVKLPCLPQTMVIGNFLSVHARLAASNYLVVDTEGKLVGLLDLKQLLQEVWREQTGRSSLNSCPWSSQKLSQESDRGSNPIEPNHRALPYLAINPSSKASPKTFQTGLSYCQQLGHQTSDSESSRDLWQGNALISSEEEKRQRLQEELVLTIGHDLKSPLTSIIGLASLLKDQRIGDLNDKQLHYSKTIYHSGKKLVNSLDDFIDVIRLTNGKSQIKPEKVWLKPICEQIYRQISQKLTTIAALKQQTELNFPELQLDIAPDIEQVVVDPVYLDRILSRPVEICLQLTSPEDLFGVSVEYWSQWLAITVWNEGGGLSQLQQEFIAQQLISENNLLDLQAKNQTIGLILAQQLAQIHGGEISFISQRNYGSEFTVLLPREPNLVTDNTLVLIGETKTKQIIDLSEKLRSLGYHTAIARNSAEVMAKAKCLQPHKIVLSSALAQAVPENLLEKLQQNPRTQTIPIVLTAARSSQAPTIASNNQAKIATLVHPISRAALAQLFPLVAPQKSYLSPSLTVLRLSLGGIGNSKDRHLAFDFVFSSLSSSMSHHIIQADSLDQAELLARIWSIDVAIWDGATLEDPTPYLESLARLVTVASIPLITLDQPTTAIANTIPKLTVFPCLLPANERSIEQLTQVIQIAAGFG